MPIPTLPAIVERDRNTVVSQCFAHFRASDMAIALIDGTEGTFSRAATASITDRNGAAITLAQHVPAFEPRDWLNTSARTHTGLLYGTSDRCSFPVLWRPAAMALHVEFIEVGNSSGNTLCSITNDAVSGARFIVRRATNGYEIVHHNGTSEVTAALSTAPTAGQRGRLFGYLYEDGAVQLWQSINEGALTNTSRTAGLAFGAQWGSGTARLRIGASGTGNYGVGWMRRLRLVPGLPTFETLARAF